jgi:hypothetical protein
VPEKAREAGAITTAGLAGEPASINRLDTVGDRLRSAVDGTDSVPMGRASIEYWFFCGGGDVMRKP